MTAADAQVPPARMPPGYEFVRMLGSGGNGWVALARHSVLGRLVAVKTIYGGQHDLAARARLEREGQALARLRHPHLVRVYELIDSGDDLMLVIEYVEGSDLAGALPNMTATGRLQVLADVAAAIEHAAANGVIHRDIKPPNVLIDRAGRAKLTDFGIARVTASAAAFRTGGSAASGTPRYVAPEQLLDPDRESPAADAYSFAVMAYEMVVGRAPFRADTAEGLIYAHLSLEPVPPRQVVPELSPIAADALVAGMAKQPEHRPTPSQLLSALATTAPGWSPLPPMVNTQVSTWTPGGAQSGPARSAAPVGHPVIPRRRSIPPFAIGAAIALVIVISLFVALR